MRRSRTRRIKSNKEEEELRRIRREGESKQARKQAHGIYTFRYDL